MTETLLRTQTTQEFAVAPRSTYLVFVTGFSLALLVGMPLGFAIATLSEEAALQLGALVYLCGSIVFLWFLARHCIIRGYRLTDTQIVVSLPARDRVFERSELTSAEVDPDAMRGTYAMPNGGLFAFGGRFCRNFRLGRYDAYATDRAHAVVLRFGEHVVVLTPRDPERFVEAVRP